METPVRDLSDAQLAVAIVGSATTRWQRPTAARGGGVRTRPTVTGDSGDAEDVTKRCSSLWNQRTASMPIGGQCAPSCSPEHGKPLTWSDRAQLGTPRGARRPGDGECRLRLEHEVWTLRWPTRWPRPWLRSRRGAIGHRTGLFRATRTERCRPARTAEGTVKSRYATVCAG